MSFQEVTAMKPTDLATHLTKFLGYYLPEQRNASPNTVKAYRDVFSLLLLYCRDVRGIAPERLFIKHLDAQLLSDFIEHLGKERHCGPSTQNHRLAVLHAFFRYLQIEEPQFLVQCQRILALPYKRQEKSEVSYLSSDDIQTILSLPVLSTGRGRRDATLLCLLYDTGARVQEIINLDIQDVRL